MRRSKHNKLETSRTKPSELNSRSITEALNQRTARHLGDGKEGKVWERVRLRRSNFPRKPSFYYKRTRTDVRERSTDVSCHNGGTAGFYIGTGAHSRTDTRGMPKTVPRSVTLSSFHSYRLSVRTSLPCSFRKYDAAYLRTGADIDESHRDIRKAMSCAFVGQRGVEHICIYVPHKGAIRRSEGRMQKT